MTAACTRRLSFNCGAGRSANKPAPFREFGLSLKRDLRGGSRLCGSDAAKRAKFLGFTFMGSEAKVSGCLQRSTAVLHYAPEMHTLPPLIKTCTDCAGAVLVSLLESN